MLMRLDDVYYTTVKLDGVFPQSGLHQAPVATFQGDDLVFEISLLIDGQPVNPDEWALTVVIKPGVNALETTWEGELNDGVTPITQLPGMYKIFVSKDVTSTLAAGTYWIGVRATEKLVKKEGRNASFTIAQVPFTLDYAITSPLPESASPEADKLDRSTIESTYPIPVKTTQQ